MKTKSSIFAVISVFFMNFVSAQSGPVDGVRRLLDGLRDVLFFLFGFGDDVLRDLESIDQYLLAKLLLFAIVLLIVYTVITKNSLLGSNNKIHWIISACVAILSIRFLPDDFIVASLFQYGALGVGLTLFLPLMIYFFFLHQSGMGSFGRKMGLMIYLVALIALWIASPQSFGEASLVYSAGIAAIIAMYLFDSVIHGKFGESDLKKIRDAHHTQRYVNLDEKIRKLQEHIDAAGDPDNPIVKRSQRQIENLRKAQDKIVAGL